MATVPTYQQQQVQQAPIQGRQLTAQMSPEAAGAGVGQAVSQLGGQMSQIAQEERQKADQLALLDADNKLAQFETNRLHDPENGALNRRGRDSFGLPDEVMEEFDKHAGEIEQGLASDRQRMAFQRSRQQRRNSIDLTINRHVSRQMQEYDDQTTNSALEMARQNALNYYYDPDRIELEIERQHALVADHANRNGLPAEYVQQKRMEVDGATYTAVLERMASESPMAAREFYDKHKDHIKGTFDEKAQTILRTKVAAYEADQHAATIAASTDENRSDWIKAANQIEDPEMRSMVKRSLNERWQEVEVERDERASAVFDQVEEGVRPQDIDAETWMQLTPQQRNTAETRHRQLSDGTHAHDHLAYAEFLEQYGQDPQALAEMNSSELYANYRNRFDNNHWDRVLNQWQQSRQMVQGDANARMDVTSTVNFNTAVKSAAIEAGVIPADESPQGWKEDQTRRFNSFEQSASEMVFMKERELGRKLYPHEMRQTIDEMATQQVITGTRGFLRRRFKDPIPAAAMLPDEAPEALPFEDIPDNAIVDLQSIYEDSTNRRMNLRSRGDKQRMQRAYLYYRIVDGVPVPEPGTDDHREYMRIIDSITDILSD